MAGASEVVFIADESVRRPRRCRPRPPGARPVRADGKPAEIVQLVLNESTEHFVAGERGPIIARHHLGHQLTSAGVDRAGTGGAWLLPEDPGASARALRDTLTRRSGGTRVAVVIADSDGRADRRGAAVVSIGAAVQ